MIVISHRIYNSISVKSVYEMLIANIDRVHCFLFLADRNTKISWYLLCSLKCSSRRIGCIYKGQYIYMHFAITAIAMP